MSNQLYEFFVEDYIVDKSLSAIDIGTVTLHAPTVQDTLLINSRNLKQHNEGWADVTVDIPARNMITISRPEADKKIQVTDYHNPDGEQLLFNNPVDSLTIMKIEDQVWLASFDGHNLRDQYDRHSFPAFLAKISSWTLEKQGIMSPGLFESDQCHATHIR